MIQHCFKTDIILSIPAPPGERSDNIKVIKTLSDLRNLRNTPTCTPALHALIKQDFRDSAREAIFPDEEPGEDFSLDGYGHLVLLEPGDSPEDWAGEGLLADQDAIGPAPEFIERLNVDGTEVYRIAIMFDNDNIVRGYSPVGIHRPELEEYLHDLAVQHSAASHFVQEDSRSGGRRE